MKSIIEGDTKHKCYLCGHYILHGHVHHCIHGTAGRIKADKYGLTVHLCPDCHRSLTDKGLKDHYLEETAQKYFEQKYSHKEWMTIFGKSYIGTDDKERL